MVAKSAGAAAACAVATSADDAALAADAGANMCASGRLRRPVERAAAPDEEWAGGAAEDDKAEEEEPEAGTTCSGCASSAPSHSLSTASCEGRLCSARALIADRSCATGGLVNTVR